MQMTSWPFWLMMVSTAMAVFPVWRSPMISSRWPRPMGIMESMALMPVCSGSLHVLAVDHARRRGLDGPEPFGRMGPLPSRGCPRGLTTRPSRASPTGTSTIRPVRLTRIALPDLGVGAQEDGTDVVLFQVEGHAVDAARELQKLAGHRVLQAPDPGHAVAHLMTVPTFWTSISRSNRSICCFRMAVISSGRMAMPSPHPVAPTARQFAVVPPGA